MVYIEFAVYALAFWAIASRWPAVSLALIFATAPFANDLSGGGPAKFSLAEVNLLLTLPVWVNQCLSRDSQPSLGPLLGPLVLLFGVSLFSSGLNWRGNDAVTSLLQMFLYLVLAVLVFSSFVTRVEEFKLALLALVSVGVVLALATIILRSGYVLGLHKNLVGGVLACVVIICFELWLASTQPRQKWLLLGALAITTIGMIFSLSRGAWLGAFCGIAVVSALRREFVLLLRAFVILIPFIAVGWNSLPKQSQDYATGFGRERENISLRYKSIDIAKHYYEQNPSYGMGVGLRKEYDATNLWWLTLAETGVVGIAALLILHLTVLSMAWTAQQRMDRKDEAFSLVAIGAALLVSKLAHGMVDHYWTRGVMMIAWSGVGMLVAAYYMESRRLPARSNLLHRRALAAVALIQLKELQMRELKGK